jgi:hypothetical protein
VADGLDHTGIAPCIMAVTTGMAAVTMPVDMEETGATITIGVTTMVAGTTGMCMVVAADQTEIFRQAADQRGTTTSITTRMG